jgi:hypothetical protein
MPEPPRKLLDQVRDMLRIKHYALTQPVDTQTG